MGVSKTSDHIQIKFKMPNSGQEPPASSKDPNEDSKDMNILCTLEIKIEGQNSEHGCINIQLPYTIKDQDPNPQAGTFSILQSPKSGLQGNWCSLHLESRLFSPSKSR